MQESGLWMCKVGDIMHGTLQLLGESLPRNRWTQNEADSDDGNLEDN